MAGQPIEQKGHDVTRHEEERADRAGTVHPDAQSRTLVPDRVEADNVSPPDLVAGNQDEKTLTPDNKKINPSLIFSPREMPPEADSRPKMEHTAHGSGRQRHYHQTIALLESYHDGDPAQFERLDIQMQRYYRREYPEYFKENKTNAAKRLANRTKAARTKREAERREIAKISRKTAQGIRDNRPEAVDV